MRRYLHICDMCKKQEITDSYFPEGWEHIEIKYRSHSSSTMSVCPECAQKVGLPVDTNATTSAERQTIEQRMLDIIQEIAYYAQG